ncbi:MAG: MarR family transcriptional regulator [Candidatus Moraniibacteriota bacterium]
MPIQENDDQAGRIVSLIFTVRNLIHEKAARVDSRKVSLLQLITLRFIGCEHPTMKEIADYLGITAPSATSLVNTLIRDGMVVREAEAEDRRKVRIVITAKGTGYMKKEMEYASRKIQKSLEVLTRKEQDELEKILGKTAERLRDK